MTSWASWVAPRPAGAVHLLLSYDQCVLSQCQAAAGAQALYEPIDQELNLEPLILEVVSVKMVFKPSVVEVTLWLWSLWFWIDVNNKSRIKNGMEL